MSDIAIVLLGMGSYSLRVLWGLKNISKCSACVCVCFMCSTHGGQKTTCGTLYHVSPRDWILVIKLDWKYSSLLLHFISLKCNIISYHLVTVLKAFLRGMSNPSLIFLCCPEALIWRNWHFPMETVSEYFPFNFARNIFFDFRKFLAFSQKWCDKFKGEQEIRCECVLVCNRGQGGEVGRRCLMFSSGEHFKSEYYLLSVFSLFHLFPVLIIHAVEKFKRHMQGNSLCIHFLFSPLTKYLCIW